MKNVHKEEKTLRRVYAVLLCFLVFFSVFSALPFQVEAQEPSGNISFQENSIPDVNVYYDDFSFVFEYKSYFIRIRPFVIYNETYYGMKQIVTWIKNNYPNVNYKWLVDKAVNAIHYGFNLTLLPQNVADHIDFLGFRLVDLNFPLSWFELEEIEIYDEEMIESPYNVTRIHIPKANLVFSFEDLYPYGYSIEHVNSTYILIGGVKNRTDLIVDPITFSSPVITVVGETGKGDSWANAYDFWDLWNVSDANGWNVVNKTSSSENAQFDFGGRIVFGDGSTSTYFWDSNVQVTFNSTAVSANGQALMDVKKKAYIQFGVLEDASTRRTSQGVDFIALDSYLDVGFVIVSWASSYDHEVNIYSSSFKSLNRRHMAFSLRGGSGSPVNRVYNTILTKWCTMRPLGTGGTMEFFNVQNQKTIDVSGQMLLGYGEPSLTEDLQGYDHREIVWTFSSYDFSVKNVYGRGNTRAVTTGSWTGTGYLINADLDSWVMSFGGTTTGEVYRQYEFDLTVTDDAGTALENANVTITHYGQSETQDFNGLTDANGQISTQTLSRSFYNQTGGDTEYAYNPFNLNIALTDYETYNQNFTLSDKTDWTIALLDEVVTETDPVARFEFSPERPYVDETITFDATNSTDPDGGSISSYSWSWGDGEADGSGVTDTHSYSSAGEYSVTLTITDDESATDSTILKVNVTDYYSPIARFTFTPSNPEQNEDITFDGTSSSDSDGTISSYSWTFGDGTTSTSSTVTKNYEAEGTFTVTLTVTDSQSKTDSTTQTVIVQNPPPPSDGGAGPAPGTTPPPIPIEISGIYLVFSWGPDSFTYYPYVDQNYAMNFTVSNNVTQDQAVTVAYWLNDGNNETVWESTYSFLMYASSELVLTLTYPISKDGSYTAYAQVIAPDPDGQIQSSQFTATSGLSLLVVFFIIIVGTILALAIIKVETSKKKGEVSV